MQHGGQRFQVQPGVAGAARQSGVKGPQDHRLVKRGVKSDQGRAANVALKCLHGGGGLHTLALGTHADAVQQDIAFVHPLPFMAQHHFKTVSQRNAQGLTLNMYGNRGN